MPVGDVVPSLLTYAEFREAVKDPTPWSAAVSKWAPADGRLVDGSRYASLKQTEAGESVRVPDLRGLFLRGLNQFDPDRPAPSKDQSDAEGARAAGSIQQDQIGSHSHRLVMQPDRNEVGTKYGLIPGNKGLVGGHHARATEPAGGSETRPKNAAVYYYIRIND